MKCLALTTGLSCVFVCSFDFFYVSFWRRIHVFFRVFFFFFSKWIVVHDRFFQFPFLRNSENVFVTNLNAERSLVKETSLIAINDLRWKLLKSDNAIVRTTAKHTVVKVKLVFIGHSGSNHSAFYLVYRATSVGLRNNPLLCAYVWACKGCGFCVVRVYVPCTIIVVFHLHLIVGSLITCNMMF